MYKITTGTIGLTTLNDEEIVMLDDIFGIVTLIHPRAVQNLLKTLDASKIHLYPGEGQNEITLGRNKTPPILYQALLWLPNPPEQLSQL